MSAIFASWHESSTTLSRDALDALLRCDIPAIEVQDFATPTECAQFVAAMSQVPGYDAHTSPMRLIGANFSNHYHAGKHAYFHAAAQARARLRLVVESSFDPVARLLSNLRRNWPGEAQVAREGRADGQYFAGCIKSRVQGSPLHYDFVPDMVTDYTISAITAQLSWNLYLEMPSDSGETTIYKKWPDPRRDLVAREPEAQAQWNNLVNPCAVEGCERFTFRAKPGELVMFNTRCPHSIAMQPSDSRERRVQIGGFAGLTTDGDFILWS